MTPLANVICCFVLVTLSRSASLETAHNTDSVERAKGVSAGGSSSSSSSSSSAAEDAAAAAAVAAPTAEATPEITTRVAAPIGGAVVSEENELSGPEAASVVEALAAKTTTERTAQQQQQQQQQQHTPRATETSPTVGTNFSALKTSAPAHRYATISGHSSGGSMAMQHLFAFSSSVVGAAIASGSAYGCGALPGGHLPDGKCYYGGLDVRASLGYIASRASLGLIDDPSNLRWTPIVLFNGKNDMVVWTQCMQDVQHQLENYVAPGWLKENFDTDAVHVWSVDHGSCVCGQCSYGSCCDVNNCNYDLSGEMLRSTYGPLWPRTEATQYYHWIEQSHFVPPRGKGNLRRWRKARFARWALAYVPTGCVGKATECRVHVDYHGCVSDDWNQRLEWSNNLDLNEYGEANNIVIIYPQAKGDKRTGTGCWNWGFPSDDILYDTKASIQLMTVKNLINHLDRALRSAERRHISEGPPTTTDDAEGEIDLDGSDESDDESEDLVVI